MIGKSGLLKQCRLLLPALLFVLAVFNAAPALAVGPTSSECAPYRGLTPPQNQCTFENAKNYVTNSLTAQQREQLSYSVIAVEYLYNGSDGGSIPTGTGTSVRWSGTNSTGIQGALNNCFTKEANMIRDCNTDNAARQSDLGRQLGQQVANQENAMDGARRAAQQTAEAGARAREEQLRQQRAQGTGTTTTNTGSGRTGSSTGGNRNTTVGSSGGLLGSATGSLVDESLGEEDENSGVEAAQDSCAREVRDAEDTGHAFRAARTATIFDRTVLNVSARAAVEAAMCIDRLFDKIAEVTSAISAVISSLNHPIIAILAALAGQIIGQMIGQLINNVINAVCEAVNEITDAIENRLKNALCIKGNFDMGMDPFRFPIDIPAMECAGWSVDLLTGGVIGQPINGVNMDWNSAVRDARGYAAQEQAFQDAIRREREAGTLTAERENALKCQYNRTDCVR